MRTRTSARRRRTSPRQWWRFQLTGLRTITDQGFRPRAHHRAFIVGAWLAHTVQRPIYRYWDSEQRRFTARPGAARISAVGDRAR
ncbi:hypothetical protein ACIHDR_30810 [Nocardia sp. NPDC052278]|uniref:hypothetical protein n=1 Tax=unclassified Nocardia TaxID=2637762 RepID=UPI0036C0E6E6